MFVVGLYALFMVTISASEVPTCEDALPEKFQLALKHNLQGKTYGRFVEIIGQDWENTDPKTIENINEQESGVASYSMARKVCKFDTNESVLQLIVELRNGKINDVEYNLIYNDENFIERAEKINPDRYDRSSSLRAALGSLIEHNNNAKEIIGELERTGFKINKECFLVDSTLYSIIRPLHNKGSISEKIGVNEGINFPPAVRVEVDESTNIITLADQDSSCKGE